MTVLDVSRAFQTVKLWLIDGTDLSRDALHIYAGLALFLIIRIVWRGRGGGLAGWCVVAVAAVGAEWLDIAGEQLAGQLQPDAAHWHDIWNTLLWPTVLLLLWRWLPLDQRGEGSGK